jgi:hypothetical protein
MSADLLHWSRPWASWTRHLALAMVLTTTRFREMVDVSKDIAGQRETRNMGFHLSVTSHHRDHLRYVATFSSPWPSFY